MAGEPESVAATGNGARAAAIKRVEAKQRLRQTALTFAAVSVLLVVIWAITGAGFFWPVFPILGMGLALALQGWNAYRRSGISEDDIAREMERGQG